MVEGTRLNFEALKKSFDGPYDRMISEVDKIDEYSQIDSSQNNYNFNLTPNRSRELTNVNRILHHTFHTPTKTATDPPTQTTSDPTTPERPNEQPTRRISKTGKKKSTINSPTDWSSCRKRPNTVSLQQQHEDYLVDAISSKYTEFWNNYGKKRQSSIKGDEKRVRKEHVEEIAELEKRLTKKCKYVSEENFQEHMQKQLDTIGETGFTMDQMTTTLSMGGLYKQ